ncbi:MAG: hypothetical protein C0490_23725, partial [Marivirga sp.]|nr:hypothetical protein [Marivirga sp.]
MTKTSPLQQYPATERQLSEWEYALQEPTYFAKLSLTTDIYDVDYDSIRQTFCALVRRHESLRTTFCYASGELRQIVHDAETFKFEIEDLDLSDSLNLSAEIELTSNRFVHSKFDRVNGPLIRAILIKAGSCWHRLIFLIDHIISDAMSIQVLEQEFKMFYKGFRNGTVTHLAPLDFQMKDYALWEKDYYNSEPGQLNLRYWKLEFGGNLSEFCFLEKRKVEMVAVENMPSKSTSFAQFFLDNDDLERIKSTYRSESIFILAALFKWLHSFSNQKKLIVAIPFSSRDREQLENVIGYLISAMYIKLDLDGVFTFRELFDLVVHKYAFALKHMWYSRRSLDVDIGSY